MAVAAVTTKPQTKPQTKLLTQRQTKPQTKPTKPTKLRKQPLPAGLPREWYESHNRRLKAMRLAIALLDTGVYHPANASNRRIRTTAERIGIHPPSDTTCRMVRSLIHCAD
ncbi:hypothetical protein [Streptomyces sp. FIT100]|uniref:hypothetical protein n=1 Tax=Streptomyces sp. FIT100 TaxID=2837956 RepID=UPI0021C96FA8|nr:hypothetical protein [Streptomyces sp. FIT100]UUN26514.1 hypothetical protein KK483_08855 [Streptomyces sp. FIT100]